MRQSEVVSSGAQRQSLPVSEHPPDPFDGAEAEMAQPKAAEGDLQGVKIYKFSYIYVTQTLMAI